MGKSMTKSLTASFVGAASAAAIILATAHGVLAEGLGSDFDASKAGDQTLTLWWLGNQEVPGIETWMAESVAEYQKLHPNITVNTVLQPVDTYNTLQKTACKARQRARHLVQLGRHLVARAGLDGCTVANEEVLAPEDLAGVPSHRGHALGRQDLDPSVRAADVSGRLQQGALPVRPVSTRSIRRRPGPISSPRPGS